MTSAAITDFSFVSPLGSSEAEYATALFSGKSGIADLRGRVPGDFPVHSAGLVPGLDQNADPFTVAESLFRQLLGRAKSGGPIDGVIFFIPPQDELFLETRRLVMIDEQAEFLRKILREETGTDLPADRLIAINEACVTGLTAINMAAQRLRAGLWKRAVVIGVDLRCSLLDLLRFHSMGALSTRPAPAARASCPFSAERDGFVKSQGGAAILIEEKSVAGDRARARIAGYGQSADAWRSTDGRPDGQVAMRAWEQALRSAELTVDRIDCFSAHATSTRLGDSLEARTIGSFFGSRGKGPPVTALKSQIGHAGQASGLLQTIAAVLMLREQKIAATINFEKPDSTDELDHVANHARAAKLNYVLCNAHAFGGQNACTIYGLP